MLTEEEKQALQDQGIKNLDAQIAAKEMELAVLKAGRDALVNGNASDSLDTQ